MPNRVFPTSVRYCILVLGVVMIPVHESNRVEFKALLNDRFERPVVAFLNVKDGGELYIGIADDGSAIGIEHVDDTRLRIRERIQTNICPSALGLVDIGVETLSGKNLLHLSISEGMEKPYYIKRYGMSEKGCFVRSSSAVMPMNARMIERLLVRRSRIYLKQLSSPAQRLSCEQLRIFYHEHGHVLNDSFAGNLDFLTDDGKRNCWEIICVSFLHVLCTCRQVPSSLEKEKDSEKRVSTVENIYVGMMFVSKNVCPHLSGSSRRRAVDNEIRPPRKSLRGGSDDTFVISGYRHPPDIVVNLSLRFHRGRTSRCRRSRSEIR